MNLDDAPNRETLAEDMYTAYCEAVGGVAFNGNPLPKWDEFFRDSKKQIQVRAWLKVADVALDSLCE